ncbi:MAG: DUF1801 domain-containing protein [Alphaproteobacteria bacterium]|nr:DUF1801 domain-containing protein [Alphaproteobacteria bacterium]
MATLKTHETDASVDAFLDAVEDERKRADARAICDLMAEITGEPPRMWGPTIVGFGRYAYTYESGRTGEWMRVGFSPRKRNLTLYIMPGFSEYDGLMGQLGRFKTGKSCLYINKLADVDQGVLRELVSRSVQHMAEKYPS